MSSIVLNKVRLNVSLKSYFGIVIKHLIAQIFILNQFDVGLSHTKVAVKIQG